MFGWEFPPYNWGGLGTACYGLTKSLVKQGVHVTFVVPYADEKASKSHVRLVSASSQMVVHKVPSLIQAYTTTTTYKNEYERVAKKNMSALYGKDLFSEVERYARAAGEIARNEQFDVIHCHDWLTFGAGLHAKTISGKPLIVHVHATEYDRTGGNSLNEYVYNIEKYGMEHADVICAVSQYVKNTIMQRYGIPGEKIVVVHNGVDWDTKQVPAYRFRMPDSDKVVLFIGRLTLQKGPEYFLYAAKRVLEKDQQVRFIMAGSGDMEAWLIEKAAELGIADRVHFTGMLRGGDVDKIYQMSDVLVMPSVSEPFGLVPLESLKNGTPVIISRQSGVSEVLSAALKVDFWDIEKLAGLILASLHYPVLHEALTHDGVAQTKRITWDSAASKCVDVYQHAMPLVAH